MTLGFGVSPAILARVARTGGFLIGPAEAAVILANGLGSPARDMVARRRFG